MKNTKSLNKYVIRFRYIPPYDYHTPLFHIPIEETRIDAETEKIAWSKFVDSIDKTQKNWLKCEEIYEDIR